MCVIIRLKSENITTMDTRTIFPFNFIYSTILIRLRGILISKSVYSKAKYALTCVYIYIYRAFRFLLFCSNVKSLWRPEYGAYMIEGTPGKPYGGLLAHFNIVEANMRYRREEAQQLLGPNEVLMTITNFPRYLSIRMYVPPPLL